ncbi:MAG: tRNA (adenosine(37)-N6)-threonylcarbamoyltransferase complex ATPase subunit type 1 TsaE [bacterium]
MNLPFKYLSKFPSETEQISKEFASIISQGDFILLKGRLGAGKTKFVSGLVKYFYHNADIVTSPTFSLMNRYFCDENMVIDHFDFYRLKNLYDLENSGFFDSLASDSITIAEWGDKINFDYINILKNYYFEVNIIVNEDDSADNEGIDNKNLENIDINSNNNDDNLENIDINSNNNDDNLENIDINSNNNDDNNVENIPDNLPNNFYRQIIINKIYI